MDTNKEMLKIEEIFTNPPAEYRGAPFWAWNTDLSEKELLWQIDRLQEMGFGGFFMHTRCGMSTVYLGKDFMHLIRACNNKAKENGMFSYLYDEDRWPSGSGGGYVTCDKKFRQKSIVLSRKTPQEMRELHSGDERDPEYLTAFDIAFDDCGKIEKYKTIAESADAAGEKWYAYILLGEKSGWYNGFTYLDTLSSEAVDKFIEVTHEAYKRELGNEFGKSVPAIFTDEPSYYIVTFKGYARDGADAAFPWTQKFKDTFIERFSYDITERMPEVIWDKSDGSPNTERYRFFMHATTLFAENYGDKIGKWCARNNLAFTGHYMEEPTLHSQMCALGEAMRHYKEFDIPGIDMLCNRKEFTTAKQAQSVVHQCGRKRMTSELYGVTGWEYDFRGHKFQGDWQAALGVTLRVPHLAWVSMRGSAKRDYPASINYQSSWYSEYRYIENHFARLNTALTRGVPHVNIAVIHPIESAWITFGVREYTSMQSDTIDRNFADITEWLLRGQADFDFVSESMLPDLYDGQKENFCVGKMQYKAVVVPPIVTIRSTTLACLTEFAQKGGKVIVCGKCPECVDGTRSNAAQSLWNMATHVRFAQAELLQALEEEREVSIFGGNGEQKRDLIYNMRDDGSNKWLFIAHCDEASRNDGADCCKEKLRICIKGTYIPTLYDTLSGQIRAAEYYNENGSTVIQTTCYPFDSFLYMLSPRKEERRRQAISTETDATKKDIFVPDYVSYELSEPNVLVLDMPEWSRDGKHFEPREEMLRIDMRVRAQLHYPAANGFDVQPWRLSSLPPCESVWLRFTIESEIETECKFAYEYAEKVILNGANVAVVRDGWFVDKEIYTMPLPRLRRGKNELVVRVPISERVSLENLFLLGDFGVKTLGSYAKIVAAAKRITFDALQKQGFPFYGANITYKIPFICKEDGTITVTDDFYIGALISARLDGKDVGKIVLPPYKLQIDGVKKGAHILELTLFGTRVNTFGGLHAAVPIGWKGPNLWYTDGNMWSYEYRMQDTGIMKKPTIMLTK